MAGIVTPAMASIERGDILPDHALRHADFILGVIEGIDPVTAFVDPEVNRHHRAVALEQIDYLRYQGLNLRAAPEELGR